MICDVDKLDRFPVCLTGENGSTLVQVASAFLVNLLAISSSKSISVLQRLLQGAFKIATSAGGDLARDLSRGPWLRADHDHPIFFVVFLGPFSQSILAQAVDPHAHGRGQAGIDDTL